MMTIQGVANAVSVAQQVQLQNTIATTIAGKQLDVMEQMGEAAVELIEAALEVAQSEEVGQLFDAKA